MQLAHPKIGTRLGFGFAVVVTIGVLVAAYCSSTLATLSASVNRMATTQVVEVNQLVLVRDNVSAIAQAVRNIALLIEDKYKGPEKARIDAARATIDGLFKKLSETPSDERGRRLLQATIAARGPFEESIDKAVILGMQNEQDVAREVLMKEVALKQAAYVKAADELIVHRREQMNTAMTEANTSARQATIIAVGLSVLSVLLGAGIAWVVTRSITRPIGSAVRIAEAVAAGRLGLRIETERQDETGQLLRALRAMSERLSQVVSEVRQRSDSIATGTAEIATGNADLSHRTEQQAGNLQQTAASMEHITATVQTTAETARRATQFASSARDVAMQGGSVVGKVVGTMQKITASSQKIADIIGVINGIAFQTKILALNAAVEAARAGDEGRGFAVVASEVRTLADRSAEAAKQITELINDSVDKVQAGAKLVDEAGKTMTSIVEQVKNVTDLVAEIHSGSAGQTEEIGEINRSVTRIDQATQQNAALVEESAAATESLKHQAKRLVDAVAVFKLEEEDEQDEDSDVFAAGYTE